MKSKIILTVLLSNLIISTLCQNPDLELTFTAKNNVSHFEMDSIRVMNLTRGGDTVLYDPDTILMIEIMTGLSKIKQGTGDFQLFQNYPNPMVDQTMVTMYVPGRGQVRIMVMDITGRVVIETGRELGKGRHSFRFTPGNGVLFFLITQWMGNVSSITMLHPGNNGSGVVSLEYMGSASEPSHLKSETEILGGFSFFAGDELMYVSYKDTLESGIFDSPMANTTYTFQFAFNIPCPGMPTVTYEGQVYNTVQVFSQCWMKENLNAGVMIQGTQNMTDNSIMEKYCYDNLESKCNVWGGLYQWNEMMQYTTQNGAQGICPSGWHIPTDLEWKILEGSVDNQFGIGAEEWNGWYFRGCDVGYRLRSTTGWYYYYGGIGIDSHGFKLLPGGGRFTDGSFIQSLNHAWLWSSDRDIGNYAWGRLIYTFSESCRNSYHCEYGYSIRCLRD